MDDKDTLPPNVSDHDLLIVLHTTMRHMARDVASIKDDTTRRLAVVEETKFDKTDAVALSSRIDSRQSKEDASKVEKSFGDSLKDHEDRMRRIERNMYIGLGILAFLQFIAPFVR